MKPAHFYITIALVLLCQAALFFYFRPKDSGAELDRIERAISRSEQRQAVVDSLLRTLSGDSIIVIEKQKIENHNTYVQDISAIVAGGPDFEGYKRDCAEFDSLFLGGYFFSGN